MKLKDILEYPMTVGAASGYLLNKGLRTRFVNRSVKRGANPKDAEIASRKLYGGSASAMAKGALTAKAIQFLGKKYVPNKNFRTYSSIDEDIKSTQYKLIGRTNLQHKLDNNKYLHPVGRLKNYISEGKYTGDYRKIKLDRLNRDKAREVGRKELESKSYSLSTALIKGSNTVGNIGGTLVKATGNIVSGIAKPITSPIGSAAKSTGSWMGRHKILTGAGILAGAAIAKRVADNKVRKAEAERKKAEAQERAIMAAQNVKALN